MELISFIKQLNEDVQESHHDERQFWWNDLSAADTCPTKNKLHDIISDRIIDFQGHNGSIQALCSSTTNNELYSGSFDSNIIVWDLKRGYIKCTLKGHQGSINALAYNLKHNYLASGSSDGTIILWNLNDYQQHQTLTANSESVLNVIFSHAHDKLLATCGESICIWNLETNEMLLRLNNEKNMSIYTLVLASSDKVLFSGHEAHFIRLWNIDGEGMLIETLYGHSGGVTTLAITQDNSYLLSGSMDKTVRVWTLANRQCIRIIQDSDFGIYTMVMSPKEDCFFTAGADHTVR